MTNVILQDKINSFTTKTIVLNFKYTHFKPDFSSASSTSPLLLVLDFYHMTYHVPKPEKTQGSSCHRR